MNVVSFYAPRPDHKYFQDYTPYLTLLQKSCDRFGHRHIVLSDVDLPGFETFRVDLPEPLMQAAIAAQLAYLRSGFAKGDTLFVGADCVLVSDPQAAFEQSFDLAFTTHPFRDCILNTGAIFVRGGVDAWAIWHEALDRCGTAWGDDQLCLASVVDPVLEHGLYGRGKWQIRFLPVDPWNLAPESLDQDCTHAAILHFRGPRKAWMPDYCAKWLGFGLNPQVTAFLNVPEERLYENIRTNAGRNLPWLEAVPAHDGQAVIVGGGPSIEDCLDQIRYRQKVGQQLFALNGAAAYLQSKGIYPEAQIVLDARPGNVRFVENVLVPRRYIGAQCDPIVFDAATGHVTAFFVGDEAEAQKILPLLPANRKLAHLMCGGITVGLTALSIAYALGYRALHLFGYDSSDRESDAHAYPQDETDAEKKRIEVWCAGRKFRTQLVMFKQAEAFEQFAPLLAEKGCEILVYGDGLLPTLAADMARRIAEAEAAQAA